ADTTEKPHRTYSEVAASRPSSPVFTSEEGTLRRPPPKAQVQGTTAKEHIPATAGVAFRNAIVVPDRKSDLSELSEPTRMNKIFIATTKNNKVLRTEKEIVFNQAEKQLTATQKEHISRRYEKIQDKPRKRAKSSTSRGEGPSNPKGKNIDPRNWGMAQLSDEDL
ncbi:hypothetical protein K443DRAFT_42234, partial [Laccaria amethystina LaAM-08-1]